MLKEEALNISNIFENNFPVQPLPYEMMHKEHVINLPSGANLVRDVRVKNKPETNSVVEVTELVSFFGIPLVVKMSMLL